MFFFSGFLLQFLGAHFTSVHNILRSKETKVNAVAPAEIAFADYLLELAIIEIGICLKEDKVVVYILPSK